VHPTSSSATSIASGDESSQVEKTKKKKKKKKKSKREEIGEVEVKFIPVGKQRTELLPDNTGNTVNLGNYSKVVKNEKIQLNSTVSINFPQDDLHSDEEEARHHKKKKKKHKKRRYSLVIDTNQDNIGEISIPIELNKSSGKPELVTSGITSVPRGDKDKNNDVNHYNIKVNGYGKSEHSSYNGKSKNYNGHCNTVNKVENGGGMLQEINKNKEFVKSTVNVSKSFDPLKQDAGQPTKGNIENSHVQQHRKRDIVTHVWDDPKKKQCAWDGSNKSDTLGFLLSGGSKVQSWEGNERSYIYNKRKNIDGENRQDDWDEEYDKGKTRKIRKIDNLDNYNEKPKTNSFQDCQNNRNSTKDQHLSPQPMKHHNGDHPHKHRHKQLYNEKYNEKHRFGSIS